VLSKLRRVQAIVTHLQSFPEHRARAACVRALHYGNYTYAGIKDILRRGLDLKPLPGGGVSLAGGRGGVAGPVIAVVILSLLRTDMTFLNVNTNLATVAQGLILVGVVMVGSLVQLRKER